MCFKKIKLNAVNMYLHQFPVFLTIRLSRFSYISSSRSSFPLDFPSKLLASSMVVGRDLFAVSGKKSVKNPLTNPKLANNN